MAQLHKKFSDNQIRDLLERYVEKKIKRVDIQKVLGIGKTRFFAIIKEYKKDPEAFSVEYIRKNATNKISPETEKIIVSELELEKKLIQDPETPVRSYNYSYIRDRLVNDYKKNVSLSTIISRANVKDTA